MRSKVFPRQLRSEIGLKAPLSGALGMGTIVAIFHAAGSFSLDQDSLTILRCSAFQS